MPEDGSQAASGIRGSPISSQPDKKFSIALWVSCFFGVCFVLLVGLLIAFMQFQARLLRAQSILTAGQLVDFAATEKLLDQERSKIADSSNALSTSHSQYEFSQNEITYRISRICALFHHQNSAEAKQPINDAENCAQFLRNIPFVVLVGARPGTPSEPGSAGAKPAITPELMKNIKEQFVTVMGTKTFGKAEISKVIDIYIVDMETIAQKNNDHHFIYKPKFEEDLKQWLQKCEYFNAFIRKLSIYQPYSPLDCWVPRRQDAAQPEAEQQPTPPSASRKPPSTTTSAVRSAASEQASTAGSSNPASPPGTETGSSPDAAPGKAPWIPIVTPEHRSRIFELVTHYKFYNQLLLGQLEGLLTSPSDFLALALVGFSGILGAILRIIFASYVSGRDPTARNIVIGPILGLICALVVYMLFRAGFIIITDQPQNVDTASLSPFVIAFAAMAAGLLSERAVDLFRKASGSWLGTIEASQASRWGVNLKQTVDEKGQKAADLASRLEVSAEKLNAWINEDELVPIEKQRELSLLLDVPVRRMFTDIPP